MAGGPVVAVGRRMVLTGLGLTALSGCARAFLPEPDASPIAAPPVQASNRLRVVVFEIAQLDLPFHAALIVNAGDDVLIYDPAGHWESEACTRDADLIRDPSPAVIDAFLAREGESIPAIGWVLHLFDMPVSAAVARRALALSQAAPDAPPLHCAFSVSRLLSQLDGFSDVTPDLVTAELVRTLRTRPDIRYSRRVLD